MNRSKCFLAHLAFNQRALHNHALWVVRDVGDGEGCRWWWWWLMVSVKDVGDGDSGCWWVMADIGDGGWRSICMECVHRQIT